MTFISTVMGLLAPLWGTIGPYVIGVLGALAALFLYGRGKKAEGISQEQFKQTVATIEVKNAQDKAASVARGNDTANSLRDGSF